MQLARNLAGEGHIKGVVVREVVSWWTRNRDQLAILRLGEQGTGMHLRRHLDVTREFGGMLPSAWYPAGLLHDIVEFFTRHCAPRERQALARRVGSESMVESLKGVYRPITGMLESPEHYARFAQRFWNLRYDSGTVELNAVQSDEHVVTVRDWTSHHPFLCLAHASAHEAIYRSMGLEDVGVSIEACTDSGGDGCRFRVHWAAAGRRRFGGRRLRVTR